jgi:hypothetical protein
VQHSAVPNAEAGRQVRGIENGSHLAHREVSHQRLLMALCRDGADLHDLLQRGRDAELDVPHEGFDRREPGVAGGCVVPALVLDMGQEFEHQGGVEVFEAELRGSSAQPPAGEDEQQPKRVRANFGVSDRQFRFKPAGGFG